MIISHLKRFLDLTLILVDGMSDWSIESLYLTKPEGVWLGVEEYEIFFPPFAGEFLTEDSRSRSEGTGGAEGL